MPPKIPTIPQSTEWKRVSVDRHGVHRAAPFAGRAIVSDLVAQGHLARDQMSAAVDEVIEMSRRRSDSLRKVVQNEVQRQLGALGLATKADLVALERRVVAKPAGARTTSKQKAPPKKAPAKKKPAATKSGRDEAGGEEAGAKSGREVRGQEAGAKKAAPRPAPKAG